MCLYIVRLYPAIVSVVTYIQFLPYCTAVLVTYLGRSQEATGNASLTGHDDSVLCEDTNTSACIVDGLNGILHLMQTTFG